MLYETLGCCWALSAKNLDGQFPIELMLDLGKIELLYGSPMQILSSELISSLVRAFQAKPRGGWSFNQAENHACALIQSMDTADFLSFHAGFHDAVDQILRGEHTWTERCDEAYASLRFHSVNLLDAGRSTTRQIQTHAKLITEFLCVAKEERELWVSSSMHRPH